TTASRGTTITLLLYDPPSFTETSGVAGRLPPCQGLWTHTVCAPRHASTTIAIMPRTGVSAPSAGLDIIKDHARGYRLPSRRQRSPRKTHASAYRARAEPVGISHL